MAQICELEAQNAARETKREAMKVKTEGSRGKKQDVHGTGHEDCVCHCIMVKKARERYICTCLQGNYGLATSEVGCVRHINKSTTHAVESERVEDIVAKENSQDTGDEERRRGTRTSDTGGNTKLCREYGLEPSLNVGIWG